MSPATTTPLHKQPGIAGRTAAFLIALAFILLPLPAEGQVRGMVRDGTRADSAAIPGVHIQLLGSSVGTVTDERGAFRLPATGGGDTLIVFRHVGFEPETLRVADDADILVVLKRHRTLSEVEVAGERGGTYIAPIPLKTEVVTAKEIEKAACCDLSSCFSSTAAVQPAVTDVITDSRELQMLSLDGVYTQILMDNVPSLMTGLNYASGVSFIPGPLIDRIFITKGTNSVLQGNESISGLVNVLLKESDEAERLYLNAYANRFLEKQFNAYATETFGNASTLLAGHMVQRANKTDDDGNGFLDLPLTTRYALFNKWKYMDEDAGVLGIAAWKYTDEERIGGQRHFDPSRQTGSDAVYGQIIRTSRIEAYTKTEILLEDAGKFNIHVAGATHRQDSWYGTTRYDGRQATAFADVLYQFPLDEEDDLTVGAAFRYLDLEERIAFPKNPHGKTYDGTYRTVERVPALIAENNLRLFDDQLTVITGVRADLHEPHGTIVTPRFFAKYDLDPLTTIRGTAGTGFRVPHPFAENSGLLASSRNIVIRPGLKPERAVNFGVNITRNFELAGIGCTIGIDGYRTMFRDMFIADYDAGVSHIEFRNAEGDAVSDNLSVEADAEPAPGLTVKAAYTFSDVAETRGGEARPIPFVSRHRALGTFSYAPIESTWRFSTTCEWHGPQHLPDTRAYPEEFRLPAESDSYVMLNAQVTKSWDAFEIYGGVENILNTRQANPILNAQNPFAPYFEPTFVWGPVRGRELYLGIRAHLSRLDLE